MTGNGNEPRLDPRKQQQAPPPEFLQAAKQQPANKEYKNTIDDVATGFEQAAQSLDELRDYAANAARRLRETKQSVVATIHQLAGQIVK